MAGQFTIARIPLVFIFDAPKTRVGNIFQKAANLASTVAAQGLAFTAIGSLAGGNSVIPGLGSISNALTKIPGLSALGSLKNKIVLPMLVNPSTLNITKTAKVVKTLTKKGQVNQYYQAEPDALKFSGVATGQRSGLILNQLDLLLKTTEEGSRNVVTMIYKYGGIYKGYIDGFSISAKADMPNYFEYNFDFFFTDRNHFNLFSLAISPSALSSALQNPKQAFKDVLKISASSLINNTGLSLRPKI